METYYIIMKNRITGTNLIFGELKAKHPDAIWAAYQLKKDNATHSFTIEEKKYFNNNYNSIEEYKF